MTRYIALYLPQYHPLPENDRWYGKGFTEWTNVAKARPLFKGHYQPHIPADLGFYDLRLAEVRRAQAQMAEEHGISAFCYWNYWFGNGKQLLEMPIWEVYKDPQIKLPFCLGWANHSWEKKLWDKNMPNEVIVKQQYLGKSDYEHYFYSYLPLFKDHRYFRVNGKPFFIIYDPMAEEIEKFIEIWRVLAQKEGLNDFYFVGKDSACRFYDSIMRKGFDAVYDDDTFNIHHNLSMLKKAMLYFKRKFLGWPTVFQYKDAIKYMITADAAKRDVIPVIAPNWDHSPRSGRNSILLDNCDPKYFGKVANKALDVVKDKPDDEKIVIIKSWNEWGEGNHLEPDLKYGMGYLDELKKVVEREC